MQVNGKLVVITGGGSGLGLALAQAMLQSGAKVLICGRDPKKLEDAKSKHPQLHTATCDIADNDQVQALVQTCESLGGADILVNNGGIYHAYNLVEGTTSLDTQLHELNVNLNGTIRMVHYFLPNMLKKPDAAIVNISSGLAYVPLNISPTYSASKAALHAWTRTLRGQLASTSVRVVEILPPTLETELASDFDLPNKMSPETMAAACMRGLARNQDEILAGQSKQLRMMSRVAPGFIYKMINLPPKKK